MNISRILAVDNNSASQAILTALLTAEGYTVAIAESGAQALVVAKTERPALILLDMNLLSSSGDCVCRQLKTDDATKNIPIILMSASSDYEKLAEMLRSGATDFIPKPINKEETLLRIKTHLSVLLKATEGSIDDSESKYLELFEDSPVGKSMTSIDGTVVPNKALCDMLGYSIAELSMLKWQDITPPEEIAYVEATISALKNGTADKLHFEKRYIRKDGSILWGDVLAYMYRDCHNRPCHFVTIVIDITERKRIELALEEQTRFANKLIDATALSTWISDEFGTAIKANRACFELFGATEEEVIGKYNIFKDEVAEQQGVMPVIRKAFATGEPGSYLIDYDFVGVRHVVVNGATHTFLQVNLTPIKNTTGKVTNVVFQAIDLTEIRRTQEALQSNELKYRIVAENTYDLETWRDPDGRYIYVSPSCKRITGYSVEDFLDNSLLLESIILAEDKPVFDAHVHTEVANHSVGDIDFCITRADGEIRWINHNCLPVYDDSGTYLGTRSNNRDITVRKNLEVEKESLQSQLYQAQKLEAIGQLASGIAHDFNNMLGGISGYADLLRLKYATDPETSEYVGKILTSTVRASHLTRQLLTFARKATVEKRLFDVHVSLTSIIDMLETTIGNNIRIVQKHSSETPLLYSDHNLLENCLLNLCINARDAMLEGGTLTIATDVRDIHEHADTKGKFKWKPGQYITIIVSDTGTGMDSATMERIFEPFFTTKEQGKGTGLGLASVYGFVKQHDGYITVDSTVGKGTCFTLYFPVTHHAPEPELPVAEDTK